MRAQEEDLDTTQLEPTTNLTAGNDTTMPPLPDPNASAPTGPVKVKIDAIEPEAGPTSGKVNMILLYLKVKQEFLFEEGLSQTWSFITLSLW